MGPREVSLAAIMTAATAALTMLLMIPFPLTRGYFNVGDGMVMLSGLLLGPWIGFFAGGVGSGLADVLLGYGHVAPATFLIKGTEGFLVGLIGYNRSFRYRLLGCIAGAIAMLAGYFSYQVPMYGIGPALGELTTVNPGQVIMGAIISLILYQIVLKAYPAITTYVPRPVSRTKAVLFIVIVAVILSSMIGYYATVGYLW